MTTYKTPGVYIEEIVKFPPSVAQVETAIPAFIGYTEMAKKKDDDDLIMDPIRITSMLEYETYFGLAHIETSIGVKIVDTLTDEIENREITVTPPSSPSPFKMYYNMQMYFANGGGPCYIVSVGTYKSSLENNTVAPVIFEEDSNNGYKGLKDGLNEIEKVDEPTLLLFPDATSLGSDGEFYSLYEAALMQCNKLQDRFTIIDTYRDEEYGGEDPVDALRSKITLGKDFLKYGAAYYPYLHTILDYRYNANDIDIEHISYEANAITSVKVELEDVRASMTTKVTSIVEITDADGGTVGNDTVTGSAEGVISFINLPFGFNNANTGSETFTKAKRDVFVPLVETLIADLETLIEDKNKAKDAINSAISSVEEDAAADDNMITQRDALLDLFEADDTIEPVVTNLITLVAKLKKAGSDPKVIAAAKTDPLNVISEVAKILNYTSTHTFPDDGLSVTTNLFSTIDSILDTMITEVDTVKTIDKNNGSLNGRKLGKISGIDNATFNTIKAEIGRLSVPVTPSASIAGVYARVDNNRGVWKAPANVGLSYVVKPSIQISHDDQEALNVDVTAGKSVNAIRAFVGKGNLVWGARTLAGNDNEWRYVSVRRFFNMAEESIKKATEQFVFEPNDKNTWVRIKAMIDNFLTQQWRAGALAGPTTDKAFYVNVGLGETMTAQDILEGNMIIEIGMAVVRPAEFIILKFSHKMQEA